ncbi:MAG: tRNA (adenosine(37)-N6)-threonylcarbamoyltransferase complex ATPase subunit type 1 TsaE [Lachnospiraceae bacterium]|nr:tRNA (adenosine(37)-N6)-threonylcarbamoyltransferase complex ATPase subunit type 1 TsaE [Lachnospiraceae bacterium]
MEYVTKNEEETFALGKRAGAAARAGTVFALTGDLGAGKSVFARGVARGLGIEGIVSSPTFTILQVYDEGRLPFYHFDVYRIGDGSEMDETGFDEYIEGDGVVLIEWAELIEELLPPSAVRIRIDRTENADPDVRKITVDGTDIP